MSRLLKPSSLIMLLLSLIIIMGCSGKKGGSGAAGSFGTTIPRDTPPGNGNNSEQGSSSLESLLQNVSDFGENTFNSETVSFSGICDIGSQVMLQGNINPEDVIEPANSLVQQCEDGSYDFTIQTQADQLYSIVVAQQVDQLQGLISQTNLGSALDDMLAETPLGGEIEELVSDFNLTEISTNPENIIATLEQATENNMNIIFNGSDLSVTFECNLDTAGFEPCSSPWELTNLTPGVHTLYIQAKDAAESVAPTPAILTWVQEAPVVSDSSISLNSDVINSVISPEELSLDTQLHAIEQISPSESSVTINSGENSLTLPSYNDAQTVAETINTAEETISSVQNSENPLPATVPAELQNTVNEVATTVSGTGDSSQIVEQTVNTVQDTVASVQNPSAELPAPTVAPTQIQNTVQQVTTSLGRLGRGFSLR